MGQVFRNGQGINVTGTGNGGRAGSEGRAMLPGVQGALPAIAGDGAFAKNNAA